MWENWISTYGYWAVLVGSIFEGETILVIAGYSVSRGYLEPLPTYLIAAGGGAFGDSMYFWLGRRFGPQLIRRLPTTRPVRARATFLFRKWGHSTAFVTRFAYGLRIVIPIVMGMARVRPAIFHLANGAAALTFAAFYLGVGFLFGEAVSEVLGRVRPYETRILLGIVLAGALFWAVREWRLHRARVPDVPDPLIHGVEPLEGPARRPEGRGRSRP